MRVSEIKNSFDAYFENKGMREQWIIAFAREGKQSFRVSFHPFYWLKMKGRYDLDYIKHLEILLRMLTGWIEHHQAEVRSYFMFLPDGGVVLILRKSQVPR
jgi:hypothetical protein